MEKKNEIEYKVYGRYALFTDPLTKTGGEKFTYQIPTYQALKGITESIYWKPTFIWVIDSVRVMNVIQMESKGIRPIKYGGGNSIMNYTYLKNVEYRVRAHFEWNENRPELIDDRNEDKHYQIAKRMIERGGRRDVFLGTRECQGYIESCKFYSDIGAYDNMDLSFGIMFHGITYPDEAYRKEEKGHMTIRLWNARMHKGVVNFPRAEECTLCRDGGKMEMKYFGKDNFSSIKEMEGE